MTKYWGSAVLAPLTKPIYVIRMRQHRASVAEKQRWLKRLREACEETIELIDGELQRMREDA